MLERVETEFINEETSWITEVPSVNKHNYLLKLYILKRVWNNFPSNAVFSGWELYIHMKVPRNLVKRPSLYHPRVHNRFWYCVYIFLKCPVIQDHCSSEMIGIMELLSYLGSYFQVWGFSFIRGYHLWPADHLIGRDTKLNNSDLIAAMCLDFLKVFSEHCLRHPWRVSIFQRVRNMWQNVPSPRDCERGNVRRNK